MDSKHKCNVCGTEFECFKPFNQQSKSFSEYIDHLRMVDSDFENFECSYCGSIDRERHLFMYFDYLKLWEKIKDERVLHFAPKKNLRNAIISKQKCMPNAEYVMANLYADDDGQVMIVDAVNMPYYDGYFGFALFNHMLEHIIDYKKALFELFRILQTGGIAILQTPYSRLLRHNIEDPNIVSKEDRRIIYGQDDHVRIFSQYDLYDAIKRTGFKLEIISNDSICTESESKYYGINPLEDLIMAVK